MRIAAKASTVIGPDEDKWTVPICPLSGGVASYRKMGDWKGGWMMDMQPNWWPAGLKVE